MIHTAFATQRRTGLIVRVDDIDATSRQDACAQVFAKFPPCTIESVCAWPVRGEAKITLDALSLRICANPIYGASFGAIV